MDFFINKINIIFSPRSCFCWSVGWCSVMWWKSDLLSEWVSVSCHKRDWHISDMFPKIYIPPFGLFPLSRVSCIAFAFVNCDCSDEMSGVCVDLDGINGHNPNYKSLGVLLQSAHNSIVRLQFWYLEVLFIGDHSKFKPHIPKTFYFLRSCSSSSSWSSFLIWCSHFYKKKFLLSHFIFWFCCFEHSCHLSVLNCYMTVFVILFIFHSKRDRESVDAQMMQMLLSNRW